MVQSFLENAGRFEKCADAYLAYAAYGGRNDRLQKRRFYLRIGSKSDQTLSDPRFWPGDDFVRVTTEYYHVLRTATDLAGFL